MSPRRNYDPAHGRPRPQGQQTDWTWLLELLASERARRTYPNTQTSGDQRRTTKENR